MKKNFSIESTAKKVLSFATKQESNNTLKFMAATECCPWCVGIIGNATMKKSLILR